MGPMLNANVKRYNPVANLVDVAELPCPFVVHVRYAQNALAHFPEDVVLRCVVTPLGMSHGALQHFSQVSSLRCFVQLFTRRPRMEGVWIDRYTVQDL